MEERHRILETLNRKVGFENLVAVTNAKWKSLTPNKRAKYDEMARLDKERYHRECAPELKDMNLRTILPLLHPSAKNKDHNYQAV